MKTCQEGAGERRAREARRNGTVVHARTQSGRGRRWEAGGWACEGWSGGAQRQGLAPGVGAGGDAGVDGGADFETLDIAVIDVPVLRLDHRNDRQRLEETVERIRPRSWSSTRWSVSTASTRTPSPKSPRSSASCAISSGASRPRSCSSTTPARAGPPAPARRCGGAVSCTPGATAISTCAAALLLSLAAVAAVLFAGPANAQSTDPIWSAIMTVGESTQGGRGFGNAQYYVPFGELDPVSLTYNGVTSDVDGIFNKLASGVFQFGVSNPGHYLDHADADDLILEVAGEELPFSGTEHRARASVRWTNSWLAANAPSLSADNFQTTLPVGARVASRGRTGRGVRGALRGGAARSGERRRRGPPPGGQDDRVVVSGARWARWEPRVPRSRGSSCAATRGTARHTGARRARRHSSPRRYRRRRREGACREKATHHGSASTA